MHEHNKIDFDIIENKKTIRSKDISVLRMDDICVKKYI